VAGRREHGDELCGSGATELISYSFTEHLLQIIQDRKESKLSNL
jgi:hypothetical protein